MSDPRYTVIVWHGEHKSLYYVINTETEECIKCYNTKEHGEPWVKARQHAFTLNQEKK